MKLLYVASTRIEAEIIKGKLAANSIDSIIAPDDEGGMNLALQVSNGVRIFVHEDDLRDGLRILNAKPPQ